MLCVFEFGFLGGSMGSAVGEKLTRSIETAIDKQVPVIIVSAPAAPACRRESCR
jgi:acetyl-CoA carboxylase carboxyl transferase subunit beta